MSAGRIWLLAGPRAGELAQQRRLAAALAQSWEEKPVFEPGQAARAAFGWTPEKAEQSGLVAPWPALVISFGKTLQAALWIKRASGGRTRIIHLGRSRDIAPAQLDEPARAAALQRLAALPRPWTCLIVGGLSRHFTLESARVEALAVQLAKQGRGGSLLVCTSPRTPPAWAAALKQALVQAGVAHEISEYADGRSREAYAEYLALADRLVVTGDSASMIADALRSGRPLQVVPLRPSLHLRRRRLLRGLFPAPLERALIRRGIWAPTVDLDRWIAALARDGLIGIFGCSEPRVSWNAQLDDDLPRLAQRVAPWLAERR